MKKYEKVTREMYETWYRENGAYRERVSRDPDRLWYHLMPETGWLNDPNGLCQFHGTYHIYYQYTPFEPTGELKLWGHATTKDFVRFTDREPVLFPDHDFDAHGVYSGSAFVEKDQIHYFYTGNVKYFDRDDYDYIMAGRGSNLVHVTSRDGFVMSEKELQMTTEDYPEDMSCHVRDPKILKREDGYYMVLGARDCDSRGLVLLYHSDDLEHWRFVNRITTKEPFGYMWECPDLFELDGQLVLICCPQGVAPRGVDYANVHQCTVMKLDYDFGNQTYRISEGKEIRQLDRGCDFYAPQTFEDESGRRILIGWMGIPDADYTNPTTEAGWQHALTIPRQLHMRNGRLCQEPLQELEALRTGGETFDFEGAWTRRSGEPEQAETGESEQAADGLVYEAIFSFERCEKMTLNLRRGVTLAWNSGMLTLSLGDCGSGRGDRAVQLEQLRQLRIYSDTSSLEIFVNNGEEVFTTRVYGREPELSVSGECRGTGVWYDLKRIQMEKGENSDEQ